MKTKLILFCLLMVSCQSRKCYTRLKHRFNNYYCIKVQRQDNLRLFIYTEGIPHYTYLKIYADRKGEILSIIKEKDSEQFYQAITHIKNQQYYFGSYKVETLDSIKNDIKFFELFSEAELTEIKRNKYCSDLKLPKLVSWVRISQPKDYIKYFDHKRYLLNR